MIFFFVFCFKKAPGGWYDFCELQVVQVVVQNFPNISSSHFTQDEMDVRLNCIFIFDGDATRRFHRCLPTSNENGEILRHQQITAVSFG